MFSPKIALFSLACVGLVATPHAQAVQRAHVSAAFGSDSNTATNCTAAAPCRFFQAAMTVTDNNGEVVVLDSGGYGAVTITQSVALIAPPGVYAGISVFPGANGVNIATAGVSVVLRGLTINGQGGNNGISMTAGNKLTVVNCVISNLTQNGISVSTAATVRVADTMVQDNGSNGIFLQNGVKATITRVVVSGHFNGIQIDGSIASTAAAVDIAGSTFDGNNFSGIYANSSSATAAIKVSMRDSRAVRNVGYGILAQSSAGGAVNLSASSNIVANNSIGIAAVSPGVRLWVSDNTVNDNSVNGLQNSSALFTSVGNNAVYGNGANTAGPITVISTQ